MLNNCNIQLTINFKDSNLDADELEELTQSLFKQMDELDAVETVERIREQPPRDVKAGADELGKWVLGILKTQIPLPNLAPVMQFIFRRLSGKKVKLKAEANGKTIELEANSTSQEEVLALVQSLKDFAKSASENANG
jgi:hypothetical protein